MKSHVLRPLILVIGLIIIVAIGRSFLVPDDFGIHGKSFTFGYYRLGNVQESKDFTVKYKGKKICQDCHEENYEENMSSKHKNIECENCHGAALNHPEEPEKLTIDNNRSLCLRCHAYLPYPRNIRATMKAVDPKEHNPADQCTDCHSPHSPNLEDS